MNYSGIDFFRQWRNDTRRRKLTALFCENIASARKKGGDAERSEIDGKKMRFAGMCLALLEEIANDMVGKESKRPAYAGILSLYGMRTSGGHDVYQGFEQYLIEGAFERAFLRYDVGARFNERGEFVPNSEFEMPEWLSGITAEDLVKVTVATMLCIRLDGSES